jgi:hypothetical protein
MIVCLMVYAVYRNLRRPVLGVGAEQAHD